MPIGSLLFGLSTYFSARTNLKNGRETRELQEKLHAQDRRDRLAHSDRDYILREKQFDWSQEQAEEAAIRRRDERMEDSRRQDLRDQANRSFDRIRPYLRLSPDAWENDPQDFANSGVKPLRVLFQRPPKKPPGFYNRIETAISTAIKKYAQKGSGHPINFPTAAWIESNEPGSYIASDLHLWNPKIPALILRIKDTGESDFYLEADMFGFPMGDSIFEQNIQMGRIPDDPQQIAEVLPFITLAAADMHFLATYGKMPLLPQVLPELIPQGQQSTALIDELVTVYRQTINTLLEEKPEIGIYAALQLAKALMAFRDKHHALEQIQQIERMTAKILPHHPQLQEKLQSLYDEAGAPEEAARLLQAIGEQKSISRADARKLLENIL